MRFPFPLQQGTLQRRYKRFLADIRTAAGDQLTVHCPNTGSMKHCCAPESRVWYWDSGNSKRKYPHTWELVEVESRYLACINTGRANSLVVEAIEQGLITELQGYTQLRTEVKYGAENSRIDILLSDAHMPAAVSPSCYVEVKNVTLLLDQQRALEAELRTGAFPDAVSQRGSKHLREVMHMVAEGHRAVLLFCVAHTGIEQVRPADEIDPVYGQTLREAVAAGVEVYAYGMTVSGLEACEETDTPAPSTAEIALTRPLPVLL